MFQYLLRILQVKQPYAIESTNRATFSGYQVFLFVVMRQRLHLINYFSLFIICRMISVNIQF